MISRQVTYEALVAASRADTLMYADKAAGLSGAADLNWIDDA